MCFRAACLLGCEEEAGRHLQEAQQSQGLMGADRAETAACPHLLGNVSKLRRASRIVRQASA
eukprot:8475068-Alexandrium_andersonii.AAC.1